MRKSFIFVFFILTACSGNKDFLSSDNKLKDSKTNLTDIALSQNSHVEADLSNPFQLFKLKKGYTHEDPSSYRQSMEEEIKKYAKENSDFLGSFIQVSELDIFPYYTSFLIHPEKLEYDRFKKWILSSNDKIRVEACLSAQYFSDKALKEVAEKYLYDSELKVTLSCLFALGKSERRPLIPLVLSFLETVQKQKHPHLFQIQIFGLQALARLMRPGFLDRHQDTWRPQRPVNFEIYKVFEDLSHSEDKGVSLWAVLTAVSLGEKSCLIYAQLSESKSKEVRDLVQRAMKILNYDSKFCPNQTI